MKKAKQASVQSIAGWRALTTGWTWAKGEGRFPIAAYSEFIPPPRRCQKPYGARELQAPFRDDDPWGWHVATHEQDAGLTPGLANIARQVGKVIQALGSGLNTHGIGQLHLDDNLYWPPALAAHAGALAHERYVFLSPLALSMTQDDMANVRWTLFGGSDQGPAKGFWRSFFSAPGVEVAAPTALGLLRRILVGAYGLGEAQLADLRLAGLRILPAGDDADFSHWQEGPLPSWTRELLLRDDEALDGVHYLLTFRPFGALPERIQQAYLSGALHLLPSPASLVFWGSRPYRRLARALPLAIQVPLLHAVARHEGPRGIRVPQSGWLHEAREGHPGHDERLGAVRNKFRRSHRWQRVLRDADLVAVEREDHIHTVLFSAHPDDVGLYGKPMARNVHIWSSDFAPVLDGPRADANTIHHAEEAIAKGRSFGYRMFYPPMQVGRSAVFWHRPLVAFFDPATKEAQVVADAPLGYLTATDAATFAPAGALELWPRLELNTPNAAAPSAPTKRKSHRSAVGERAAGLFQSLFAADAAPPPDPAGALTFGHTARRDFEVRYWKTIASLAEGRYLNQNSGDVVQDVATQARRAYPERDLDNLGDYLLAYYARLAEGVGMKRKVVVGAQRFPWRTDFNYPWMGGWLDNQKGAKQERNIFAVIPGKNRSEAVIMADHYDTAYMEDVYGDDPHAKGAGARLAAAGADDNHSATAALMLGAEIFLELSRKGQLECDIWLVHLTGEEFPADSLGARNLSQALVEGTLRLWTGAKKPVDLSGTRVRGLYVLDMVAHNNERRRDIFQISPGSDRQAIWLALQAHVASESWTKGCELWNASPSRRRLERVRRSPHGGAIPLIGKHLAPHGEVRLHDEPTSTLFNTDGQIFADAGVPTVLFMENYDIDRKGYHDTGDTMANIDLDYGAAVAAIAIESVARAATRSPPRK